MERPDVRELRKHLKKAPNQEGIVDWIYGFYVTPENEVAWESVRKFYEMEEDEKFRHTSIITRVISPSIGKDMFPIPTKQNESILSFKGIWENDKEAVLAALKPFRDSVVSGFSHTDPYYASLTHFLYDVPTKASDGSALEDGGEMYDAFLLSVCPAKLSAPTLGFEEGTVETLRRRWVIGSPTAGFLYPSFSDRGEDRNEVAVYMKKEEGREIAESLFELEEEIKGPAERKRGWNSILSEVGVTAEAAAHINASLNETDATSLGAAALKELVEDAGCDADRFEEVYEKVAGDAEFPVAAISSAKTLVETDSAKIQMPAEKAVFIRTETIDGIEYILIPVDGIVSINGAEIVLGGQIKDILS